MTIASPPSDVSSSASRQARRALATALAALEGDPTDPAIWRRAAEAMVVLGAIDDAVHALRQAAALAPHVPTYLRLGGLLDRQGARGEPEAWYRRALELSPDHVDAHVLAGRARLSAADLDAAAGHFAKALAQSPRHVDAAAGAAEVLDRRGDSASAWSLLCEVVATAPVTAPLAMAAATVGRHVGHAADALDIVDAAIPTVHGHDRAVLLHARGDLLDRLGRHAEAWQAWSTGNAARGLRFDAPAHRQAIATVCEVTRHLPAPTGPADERPVFVVGMPRSGTTLVERILAAHPQAHGVGELEALRDLAVAVAQKVGASTWLSAMPVLDRLAPAVGQTYLNALERHAPGDALRIVDKMPNNALHLGLAAVALPRAHFVWCVRDDDDNALGIFGKALSAGLPWAASLEGIRAWQQGLDTLRTHWSEAIDRPIHVVRYEDLVRDPEGTCRALLAHVGLPWDPAVLRFHEHAAGVATASWDQVNRPLSGDRIGRAAPYRAFLHPADPTGA